MVRPIAQRFDKQLIQKRLGDTLKKRLHSLKAFRAMLDEDEITNEVVTNDKLFGSLLHLAMDEYQVQQSALAADLNTSVATVGRWAKAWMERGDEGFGNKASLPPGYARMTIVEAVKRRLDETIAAHEKLYTSAHA